MKSGRIWMGVISCLTVVTVAQAVSDNPYQKIIERNVFGLKAQPPPPPPPEPPPPPVPKITLQGITSILGRRQVLFRAQAPPAPGRPPMDRGYILSEGQREDDIEAVAISVKDGTVKFNNHGSIQLLDMKTDAAKATPGAAIPVAAAKSPIPVPVFNGSAGGGGGGGEDAGLRRIPQRNVRTTPEEPEPTPEAASSPYTPASAPPANEPPPLSMEEQTILIEVNRENTKEEVRRGELPPLPPTDITPPDATGMPKDTPPPVE